MCAGISENISMDDTRDAMIPITKPYLTKAEAEAVQAVLASGWVSQGPKVKEFELKFAAYTGAAHACAVSSCTAALHLALLGVGVQRDDLVATVSHSFIATANSVLQCGAEPRFLDIQPGTLNLDPEALRNFFDQDCTIDKDIIVEKNSKKRVAAVLVPHQVGIPCDLESIVALCKKHDLPLVEDAACAIGSEIKWQEQWEKIGKPHGGVACFSLHPRKVITTGEGGMITTDSAELDGKFRLLRHHGMSISDSIRHGSKKVIFEKYVVPGFNYRMTDIQAAIGIQQLGKLPAIVTRLRQLRAYWIEKLESINWLECLPTPAATRPNWQSLPMILASDAPCSRDQLMQYLLGKGIASRPGIMNIHDEEPFFKYRTELPNSKWGRDNVILMPLYYELKESAIDRVARILAEL